MTKKKLKDLTIKIQREITRRSGWYSADSDTISKMLEWQLQVIEYLTEPPSKDK